MDFWQHWQPGESGAHEMLEIFCDGAIDGYKEQRNLPDRTGTSKLSPHLHFGEISPQQIWRRIDRVRVSEAAQGDIGHFKSELGWREFSYHLLHHFRTRKYCSNGSAAKPAFRLLTRACVSSGIPAGCTTAYA
jgi:deoxyribodipyrimidine photo-lyase